MAEITLTGTVRRADGEVWAHARVDIRVDGAAAGDSAAEAVADGNGVISHVISTTAVANVRCIATLPDGSAFQFDLDPEEDAINIGTLRSSGGSGIPTIEDGGSSGSDSTRVTVGTGGSYATIKEAMAAITDASATKIYTLELWSSYKRAPNQWDTFQWLPFVQIDPVAGRLGHRQRMGRAYDEGASLDFDKAFQGLDFTPCVNSDPPWSPFQGAYPGMIMNYLNGDMVTYADITAMLAGGASHGSIVGVEDDGTGCGTVFILQGSDPSELSDWVNIQSNCAYVSFAGCDLTHFWGRFGYFYDADFILSGCRGAEFHFANLQEASFWEADCTGAIFVFSRCVNTTFQNTDCSHAHFTGANLTGADLFGMNAVGANFTGATMPATADTKAEFKALVGNWNAVTTIWTDGNPIG